MLGFEIWKNGKKLAVAGLQESGAVSFMLTWVGRGAGASARAVEGVEIDGLDLRVGGIDSPLTPPATRASSGSRIRRCALATTSRFAWSQRRGPYLSDSPNRPNRSWPAKPGTASRPVQSVAACVCTIRAAFPPISEKPRPGLDRPGAKAS